MEIDGGDEPATTPAKRTIADAESEADEDAETKRRRLILEEAQELDADSAGSSEEDSDEE
jgi:protein CWC15